MSLLHNSKRQNKSTSDYEKKNSRKRHKYMYEKPNDAPETEEE